MGRGYYSNDMSLPDPVAERSRYVSGEHTLQAVVEVHPDMGYSCPIAEIDSEVKGVQFNAIDDECRVDLTLADGRVIRATDELSKKECICSIFQELDCVPHFNEIEDGTIQISTYLEEHSAVRDLIQQLRTVAATVRLVRLTAIADETGRRTVLLDLDVLTEKQREALELAVGRGYYKDNDIDLQSLATELDISAAALSQRLKRAEANIVSELVG